MMIIRAILYWVGDLLLRSALDAASKDILKRAVISAEASGLKGQDKMRIALNVIKTQGTESLKQAGESKLRTLIEEQLDRLTR